MPAQSFIDSQGQYIPATGLRWNGTNWYDPNARPAPAQPTRSAATPGYAEASPAAPGAVRSRFPAASVNGSSSYGGNMGTMQDDYARIMGDYSAAIDRVYNDIGVQTETEARNTAERRLSMGRGVDASMVSRGLSNFTIRDATLAEHAKTTDELLGNIRDQGRGRQNALRLSGAQTMLAANQRAQSEARQFALDQQRFGLEQARLLQQQRQYDRQYELQRDNQNRITSTTGPRGGGGGGGLQGFNSSGWFSQPAGVRGYGGFGPQIGNAAYGIGYGDPGLGRSMPYGSSDQGYYDTTSGNYGGYEGEYSDFDPAQYYNEYFGGGDPYAYENSGWEWNDDSGLYDYYGG